MTIGGPINYLRLSQLHRPRDPLAMAREVSRLLAQGWSTRDVSEALRLPLGDVLDLLAMSGEAGR